jgi:hypothetical protein
MNSVLVLVLPSALAGNCFRLDDSRNNAIVQRLFGANQAINHRFTERRPQQAFGENITSLFRPCSINILHGDRLHYRIISLSLRERRFPCLGSLQTSHVNYNDSSRSTPNARVCLFCPGDYGGSVNQRSLSANSEVFSHREYVDPTAGKHVPR